MDNLLHIIPNSVLFFFGNVFIHTSLSFKLIFWIKSSLAVEGIRLFNIGTPLLHTAQKISTTFHLKWIYPMYITFWLIQLFEKNISKVNNYFHWCKKLQISNQENFYFIRSVKTAYDRIIQVTTGTENLRALY